MKTELEIQRAHDLLLGFVKQAKAEGKLLVGDVPSMITSLDVLCWALEHENNQTFAENLLALEAFLFGKGIELADTGELKYSDVDQEREG